MNCDCAQPRRFPRRRKPWLALSLTAGLFAALFVKGAEPGAAELPPPVARPVDFAADVEPIFAKSCYQCHGPKKQKSDYRLDDKDSALKGGSIGGGIVPGKSADSLLIHYVAGIDEETQMPPKGPPLTAGQVGILRAWIDQGAK